MKSPKEYLLIRDALILLNDKLEKQRFLRKSRDYRLSEDYKTKFNIKKKALENLNYELKILSEGFIESINVDNIEEDSTPRLEVEEIKQIEEPNLFENPTLQRIYSDLEGLLDKENLVQLKTKKDRIKFNKDLTFIEDELSRILTFFKNEPSFKFDDDKKRIIIDTHTKVFDKHINDKNFTSQLKKTTLKYLVDKRSQFERLNRVI